jgi:hypothetical protein
MSEFKDLEVIDWNTFADSKVITENESLLLQNLDHYLIEPPTLAKRIEDEGVKKYVGLFQSVLKKISATGPVKRILYSLKSLLTCNFHFLIFQYQPLLWMNLQLQKNRLKVSQNTLTKMITVF